MKISKYDRQLRIWGAKGQKALAQSSVAIIGCSGPSIQTAKNLILPGVGKIDIWDNTKIQLHHLSDSFFYSNDSVGKYKAQEASKQLLQMNSDVKGQFFIQPPQYLIDKPEVLNNYSLVIASNLTEDENKNLSKICWKANIPIIFITAIGFLFHIRIQKQTHIVESQNISAKKYYLQLDSPFQSLKNYCQAFKIASLLQLLQKATLQEQTKNISKQLSKIPYPVLLYQAYKSANNKKSNDIKDVLKKWKDLLMQDDKHNFSQAISRTFDLFQTPDNFLPNFDIIYDQNATNAQSSSQFIFIFLKAVRSFYEQTKRLPQPVKLPDIHTSTKDYLEIKNTYKVEHIKNRDKIKQIILGWFPDYMIDQDQLSSYIDNIDALQIVKMKPYFQQLENPDTMGSSINYLSDQKNLLLALRSYQKFIAQNQTFPTPADIQKVMNIATELQKRWSIDTFDDKYIREICRYSGKNMISLSSIAGAIAGQQSIKLITKCFAPLNNGYFFDGIKCKGYSITL